MGKVANFDYQRLSKLLLNETSSSYYKKLAINTKHGILTLKNALNVVGTIQPYKLRRNQK